MKIAAASCSKVQSLPQQPAWAEIQAAQPDVLLLLGDNIYLDHDRHDQPDPLAEELRGLYARQFAQPAFAALMADLRARGARVCAIYDDHDFLGNNRYGGDHAPELREAARNELIRAFAPPQTGPEVYSLQRLGLVDLVMLDVRFHRRRPADSSHDRDAVLGPTQWLWLEQVVAASQAPYLLVGSSSTVHRFADESWEQYPAAFQRLVRLLSPRVGALVVSGDVHRNAAYDDSGLIEIVTSGVARHGLIFGGEKRNWGLLDFSEQQLHVTLHGRKVGDRLDFRMPLTAWALP